MEAVLVLLLLICCVGVILVTKQDLDNAKLIKQLREDDLKTNEALRNFMETYLRYKDNEYEFMGEVYSSFLDHLENNE